MADRLTCAGLADAVYGLDHTGSIPNGWLQIDTNNDGKIDKADFNETSSGFAGAAYKKAETGEIVVAFSP